MTSEEPAPGYRLRGGRQPDVAAVRNVLAHHDVRGPDGEPPSEPLVFLVSGGIGAGYTLWESTRDGSKPLALGFRTRWQRPKSWLKSTVDRLGLEADVHTGGARGAAKRLTAALDRRDPVLVLPDRYTLGYWGLPERADGMGGHFVVAYAEEDGNVFVDDRNLAPLTVDRKTFDAARNRVRADRNLLVSIKPGELRDPARAVRAGLADCVRELSHSLPAWGKWAKLMTDERAAKGWPTVFADRQGLVGALLSVWENVDPHGMTGGHLRDLFADGLTEAAPLLGTEKLDANIERWRMAARRWRHLALAVTQGGIPEFDWLRGLTEQVTEGVRAGDAGRDQVATAAAELHPLRAHYDAETQFTEKQLGSLFADIAARLRDIHAAETEATAELSEIIR